MGKQMTINPKVVVKKGSYFSEIKQEMTKVTWTTKEELVLLTKIVIGSVFVFALGIYFTDIVIRSALQTISFLARIITG